MRDASPRPPSFAAARNRHQQVRAAGLHPDYWYPVEYDARVRRGQIIEVQFWGQSIALYRGADGWLRANGWPAPYPMASMMPRMRPLRVGDHTFQVFVELSAEHCDGFFTDPEMICLPAGEFAFTPPRPLTISRPVH